MKRLPIVSSAASFVRPAFSKTIICGLAFAVAVFATAFPATALGQSKVALVDVGQVFKSHPVFTQQLDGLKAEADQFQKTTQQLQQQLMSEAEVLKNYEPSSAEFRAAETELAKKSAAMEVQQRDRMRVLMEKEAKLHFDTYMEIKQLIGMYCEQTGAKLVLRYNNVEMKANDAASIMQRVNGNVVYNRPQSDITAQIIAQLTQKHSASAAQPTRR